MGKTNILSWFIKNKFNDNTKNTIGVDFYSLDLIVEGKGVKI